MTQEKTTLEMLAATVDDAVATGLQQLGLSRNKVEVEILDQGSRGLFGLGSRQARVRLVVISPDNHEPDLPSPIPASLQEMPQAAVVTEAESFLIEEDDTIKTARAVVTELLEKMKVKASLKVSYLENGETRDRETVLVDIEGNDLSILIGRRSETLYALQYISGLIISKELDRLVPIVIDVQGYRLRRERQLQQLARRMADQALHTGKRQSLEPMPANERRIIHIELRDNPRVTTESMGDEPNRKVTIIPKK